MTGAFQLALTRANPKAESLARPGTCSRRGRPKDLRRHGKYLADGFREWATALGVVLRGVAASLTLLTLCVVVLGLGLNAFYRAAPVVDVTGSSPVRPGGGPDHPGFPAPSAAVWLTLASGAAVAAAAVVFMVEAAGQQPDVPRGPGRPQRLPGGGRHHRGGRRLRRRRAGGRLGDDLAHLGHGDENPVPAASFTAIVTTLLTWFAPWPDDRRREGAGQQGQARAAAGCWAAAAGARWSSGRSRPGSARP